MVETDLTRKVWNHVQDFYRDRIDECGRPVFERLKWVAEQMDDESAVIAALMQDMFHEPLRTWFSFESGFPTKAFDAINVLFYYEDREPYDRYIEHVMTNETAAEVKMKDLEYRSDPENYVHLTTELIDRILMYRSAYWQMFFHMIDRDDEILQYDEKNAVRTECCGDIVPLGYRYCPDCGKEIDPAAVEHLRFGFAVAATRKYCEMCGNWEPLYHQYCGRCGHDLSKPGKLINLNNQEIDSDG